MNKNEMEQFFNKVKGKKIKWTSWLPNTYLIPRLWNSGSGEVCGTFYLEGVKVIEERDFEIYNGFDENIYGRWKYYDEDIEESGIHICKCDMRSVLLITGCKCGGK